MYDMIHLYKTKMTTDEIISQTLKNYKMISGLFNIFFGVCAFILTLCCWFFTIKINIVVFISIFSVVIMKFVNYGSRKYTLKKYAEKRGIENDEFLVFNNINNEKLKILKKFLKENGLQDKIDLIILALEKDISTCNKSFFNIKLVGISAFLVVLFNELIGLLLNNVKLYDGLSIIIYIFVLVIVIFVIIDLIKPVVFYKNENEQNYRIDLVALLMELKLRM